jgi:hypothetical protein
MGELVGVHGMAQHQLGRHQLQGSWIPALADGLERALGSPADPPQLHVAFYGDVFLPDPDRSGRKSGDGADLLDDMDSDELPGVLAAAGEAITAQDLAAAENEVPKGWTRFPRPLQVVLQALDRRFGAAAGILYLGVLRQVRRYLCDPDIKAQVDARVEPIASDGCRVLIGHSLGSVVAYEYLRQHPGHGVVLFMTLGSPLGLRMVRSRLQVGPLDVPAWVTVRDLRDPVACAGTLQPWWPQIREADEVVVDNGSDTHSVERYLSRKATGQALLRALPHLAAR